jgi:hypothetical protein
MADEKLEAVTVHVPPDAVAWLRAEAARTDRPVSYVVRHLVTTIQHLRKFNNDESVAFVREEMLSELLQQPVADALAKLQRRRVP